MNKLQPGDFYIRTTGENGSINYLQKDIKKKGKILYCDLEKLKKEYLETMRESKKFIDYCRLFSEKFVYFEDRKNKIFEALLQNCIITSFKKEEIIFDRIMPKNNLLFVLQGKISLIHQTDLNILQKLLNIHPLLKNQAHTLKKSLTVNIIKNSFIL